MNDPLRAWAAESAERLAYRDAERVLSVAALDRLVDAAPPEGADWLAATLRFETILELLRRWRAGRSAVLVDPRAPAAVAGWTGSSEPAQAWSPEHVLAVVSTTGTSGAPKAVPIRVGQAIAATEACRERLGLDANDVWLACLPLHHVGGLAILWRALWARVAIELCPFDAPAVSRRLASGELSLVSLVPTMVSRLDRAPKVRAIVVGGAPMANALELHRRGWPICRSYGATETAAMVALDRPGDPPTGPIPLLREIDAWTEHGQLVLRGAQCGGTWRSQDLGRVVDGGLEIDGRADRVIISGGKKVSLDRVERHLAAHPNVRSVVCAAIPDPDGLGELLGAWIELDASVEIAPWAALLSALRPEERPRRWTYGVDLGAFKTSAAARLAWAEARGPARIEVRAPALEACVAKLHSEER